MKLSQLYRTVLALLFFASLFGCSGTSRKSPEVPDNIRKSPDQVGLRNAKVSEGRHMGVVTLTGDENSQA
jgi:hypothetical protein